eukprot:995518-Amphidinium_carterae.1
MSSQNHFKKYFPQVQGPWKINNMKAAFQVTPHRIISTRAFSTGKHKAACRAKAEPLHLKRHSVS